MAGRVTFGVFEFEPASGELSRGGRVVRLQRQPALMLAALVAQPGDIVTRETLQAAIWGSDTHVDFERGLNFCAAQIRSALGDSAASPRFLETIPRRGTDSLLLSRLCPPRRMRRDHTSLPTRGSDR